MTDVYKYLPKDVKNKYAYIQEYNKLVKKYGIEKLVNMTFDEIKEFSKGKMKYMYDIKKLNVFKVVGNPNDTNCLFQVNDEFIKLKNLFDTKRNLKQFPYYKLRDLAYMIFEKITIEDIELGSESAKDFLFNIPSKKAKYFLEIILVCEYDLELYKIFIDKYELYTDINNGIMLPFSTEYKDRILEFDNTFFNTDSKYKSLKKFVRGMGVKNLTFFNDEVHEVDVLIFLSGKHFKGQYKFIHILFLEYMQYPNVDKYFKQYYRQKRRLESMSVIPDTFLNVVNVRAFYKLLELSHNDSITNLVNEEKNHPILIKNLKKCGKPKVIFRLIIDYVVSSQEIRDKIIFLCPARFRCGNVIDFFNNTSEWHKKLLEDIISQVENRVKNNSTYVEDRIYKLKRTYIRCLNFIEKYTIINYGKPQIDALKWFIYNCNINMVSDVILQYGNSIESDQQRVKSVNPSHQAKRPVNNMFSLFRQGLKNYISCHTETLTLKMSDFTNNIEKKIEPFDSNIRRVLRDEEFDRMMKTVEGNAKYELLLVLLHEVALRNGAICKLQARDIIDFRTMTPLHKCRVLEKRRKYRDFLTSTTLKKKIINFIRYCDSNDNIILKEDSYVFSFSEELTRISTQTGINSLLKRITKNAGVEINVHPHMFRHTVVGKLMKNNSAEVVSRYIGHKDVTTTLNHYWLVNIEELNKDLINPFNSYNYNNDTEEEVNQEIRDKQRKIDSLLKIIYSYNEAINNNNTKADILRDISSKIPDLNKLIDVIENSEIGTTIGSSSISSFSTNSTV